MTNRTQSMGAYMAAVAVGIIVAPVLMTVAAQVDFKPEQRSPFLETPAGACIEARAHMRFNHMSLLKEMRTRVVRQGQRGEQTLDSCRECHPKRRTFCNRCHDAAGVALDCFQCHHYPDP